MKGFSPDQLAALERSLLEGQRMQLETHRIGGDIENPRGGVRGVIPSKRVY